MKKSVVKFNREKLVKQMFSRLEKEQTELFISYAKEKIKEIGADFANWDRTGNLISSLCWIVCSKGQRVSFGYFSKNKTTDDSYLHELSKPPLKQLVDGRIEAQKFISEYQPTITHGWEVIFAVCAPYWGYWEEGHKNILMGGKKVQFAVMAQEFDKVRKELPSPCKVRFNTYVPTY